MNSLSNVLFNLVVEYYALALKTQNYHWNVEGPHFNDWHAMFESHYLDMTQTIDTAAELIRGLGDKVPVICDVYSESLVRPALPESKADCMIHDMIESYTMISVVLNQALNIAKKEDDDVVIDFLVGRLSAHRKTLWILKSLTA